ncbi:VOC family protein [Paenibacillus macerans]|uniref:VOC family protein n=1 Tax=Paenibacillus macerans TaxID=44252 RepID=UPI003D31B03D
MNPILNQIGTVFVPVSDIERARDWYCGLLGLPVDGEVLHGHLYVLPMEGTTSIVLDSNIYARDKVFRAPAFHFNTRDIKEAYAYMISWDVELTSGIEHDHWFTFKDPDGNLLMVCQC